MVGCFLCRGKIMQTNAPSTDQLRDTMTISDTAHLEFGFRIDSTQESYRILEKILGKDDKVKWAKTPTHKSGATKFRIDGKLDRNDRIAVASEVHEVFDRFGGSMMVKLATSLPTGHYANLALYEKLLEFDRMQPQRENGDWVYSLPLHGLKVPIEGQKQDFKFFFVIRIDGDERRARCTIDRINVTRGVTHFTVRRQTFDPITADTEDLALTVKMKKLSKPDPDDRRKMKEYTPFASLPLEKAVDEFVHYQRNGVG